MHALTNTFDLVQRVQAGDRQALETLAERYYDRVRRIVRARIGAQLRQRLETTDVLNETFAKAITIFDRFEMRDEGSMLRWLGQIAEGKIRDEVDKQRAQKRSNVRAVAMHAGDDEDRAMELAAQVRGPATMAVIGEHQEMLEQALDKLKPEYREAIIAREFEGLSWEDVANATDRPSANAARMFFAKAKAELTVLMTDDS